MPTSDAGGENNELVLVRLDTGVGADMCRKQWRERGEKAKWKLGLGGALRSSFKCKRKVLCIEFIWLRMILPGFTRPHRVNCLRGAAQVEIETGIRGGRDESYYTRQAQGLQQERTRQKAHPQNTRFSLRRSWELEVNLHRDLESAAKSNALVEAVKTHLLAGETAVDG